MKNKYLPILIAGVIVILSVIIYFGRSCTIKDLPEILDDGRLSVLIESGEHGFTKDSTKVYGFQYEIIKAFSNSIGVELLVINENNAEDGVNALKTGQCDVLVSLRPVVNDSTLPISYLFPIISTRLMLVQRIDRVGKKIVTKQYELDKDTITLMSNSPYFSSLSDLSEEVAADITYKKVQVGSLDDLVKMVSDKKCTYTICPEYLAGNLKSRHPDVDISVPLSLRQDLSWSINKCSVQLREQLNKFLEEFVDSHEFRMLQKQYFLDK